MAHVVPFSVAANVITMLGSSAFDQIGTIYGVKKDLKKLKDKLLSIKAALVDAEDRQEKERRQKSYFVQEWIKKVKDVVYEADDVLDAFATKLNLETANTVKDQVREFFSSSNPIAFRIKMANRVKEIRERMDEIAAGMSQFNFIERIVTTQNGEREQFHSFVLESDVFGRDKEKEEIINLLKCSSTSQENLSVIAIVGIGGLGKTTLAQLVCNDDRVKQSFEPRMWVCVSEDFNVKMLVEKIIRSATNGEVGNLDMDQLQSRLRGIIREKRFLLVLDDVWNQNDRRWDDLKILLVGGAKGSAVIVTTRSRTVASVMGAENPYVLEGLTENKSWELFQKLAFRGRQEKEHPGLIIIGKDIVKKCRGVPLAIRTLASVLSKCGESEWVSIQENEIWMLPQDDNDIMPVLRLSYEFLPIHLRQCFAYCSIFPKDVTISKQTLIQLWMAQGYFQSYDGNELEGDIGDRYFKDLLSRSFFQEAQEDDLGNIKSCKMHDLIHDLAKSIVGTDFLIGKIGVEKEISERVHHVSVEASGPEFLRLLLKAKRLRTILQVDNPTRCIDKSSFHIIVSKLKSLRVLNLSHLNMKTLPNSIGKLKHLRYLGLSWNMELKSLPNSVCNLHNLQTLNVTNCKALTEFPTNIGKLINLLHLMIDGCKKLTHMPVGLGKLISLQLLQRFIVTDVDWRLKETVGTLNELKGLNHLRGKLVLENLHNVRDAALESTVTEVNLKEKKYLQSLSLKWTSQTNGAQNSELLLDNLQPHSNLKELVVHGYEGTRFSGWLSSIIHLVRIIIRGCEKCIHLPPLDQLPCLKFLTLEDMGALEYVDDGCRDFSSSSASALKTFFPSLTKLTLICLPNLKGFINEAMTNLHYCQSHFFPRLSQLDIKDCPKLTSMPSPPNLIYLFLKNSSVEIIVTPEFPKVASTTATSSSVALPLYSPFPKLEYLNIQNVQDCVSLPEEELSNLTSLKFLSINECPMLTSLSQGMRHLIALQELGIRNCLNLASLPEDMHLIALKILFIIDCPNLTSLPKGMHLTALQHLEIHNCPNLTSLPKGMHLTALQYLEIHDCPNLTSLPEGMHLTALQLFEIHNCPNLTSLPKGMHLTALQYLEIHDCPNLTSLPKEMHFTDLRQLEIRNCPNLWLLPERMHLTALQQLTIHNCRNLTLLLEGMHLTALQQLKIYNCRNLTSLREGMHLTSLQQLEIYNCPNLTSLSERMHLTSLQQLEIYNCPNLMSLPEGMHLTSLQQLKIRNCPNLTSLPEGMHLTTLQQLRVEILNCPNLTSLPEGMHLNFFKSSK